MIFTFSSRSQDEANNIKGKILAGKNEQVPFAAVSILNTIHSMQADAEGYFEFKNIPPGNYTLAITAAGFKTRELKISSPSKIILTVILSPDGKALDEIVVTGTLKEIGKDDSPVNIDIITPKLFQKTSTPNLFEATSLVNGVKPQINCNVCNTGDIHINGLEGPYTLILIDGMPIVSGLSSVYGLMGIPASMIERLEIAKGPAGALYGTEAMGGTINLITKNPSLAPKFYVDYYGTSYKENNLDVSFKIKTGNKANWLIGANGFFFDNKVDKNNDGFTDVTLQKRVSVFNKVSFDRRENREFTVAGRYVYEDRWGGQLNWNKNLRGGDSVYGESIYAKRVEFISKYQWPLKEKIFTQLSYNLHDQNSYYGKVPFMALQSTGFAQTYWNKPLGKRNDFLMGLAYKNLWFDDNTVITRSANGKLNKPEVTNTAGLFLQNETILDSSGKHKLLLGIRMDYHDVYKFIPSPRIAYKWAPDYKFIFRANFGTGFRIVNVFTEDHAALTGARQVVFITKIKPEKSFNGTLNFIYKMQAGKSSMIIWDASFFYYFFTNKIYANYDLDPDKVVYNNLNGFAFSRGISLNATLASTKNFKFIVGATYADVENIRKDSAGKYISSWQLQAPKWSGNIIAGYTFPEYNFKLDITGNWYGPQRLPILPNDFRPEFSPWFCLLNLQASKTFKNKSEFYAGIKNLFNFIPKDPLMRPFDPFDKQAGNAQTNPNGYSFDTGYNYAPIQGIRAYLGIRITFN